MWKTLAVLFAAFVLFAGALEAATVHLKDGRLLRGAIVEEDESSILMETDNEWMRVPRSSIESIREDGAKPASSLRPPRRTAYSVPQEETGEKDALRLTFGSSFGIFAPLDDSVSYDHSSNFMWGLSFNAWKKRLGLQVAYEDYRSTAHTSMYVYNTAGFAIDTVACREDLAIRPLWLSLLFRDGADSFAFVGFGAGLVFASSAGTQGTVSASVVSGVFPGYQLLAGFSGRRIGLTVKYSAAGTNGDWNNVGLGGFATLLNVHF